MLQLPAVARQASPATDKVRQIARLLYEIPLPPQSITMVWNIGFATLLLHEVFTPLDAAVTTLLLIRAVLAVVFGRKGQTTSSFLAPAEIRNLMGRDAVAIFTPIIGAIMLACIMYHRLMNRRRAQAKATRWQVKVDVSLMLILAGAFSGWTGFLSKGFVSLLAYAAKFDAGEVFTWYGSYMLGFFLPVSVVLQVRVRCIAGDVVGVVVRLISLSPSSRRLLR